MLTSVPPIGVPGPGISARPGHRTGRRARGTGRVDSRGMVIDPSGSRVANREVTTFRCSSGTSLACPHLHAEPRMVCRALPERCERGVDVVAEPAAVTGPAFDADADCRGAGRRDGLHGEVVGRTTHADGEDVGECDSGRLRLLVQPCPQCRHGEQQSGPFADGGHLVVRQLRQRLAQRPSYGLERSFPGRPGRHGGRHQGVVIVLQDDVFLGGEVAKEGRRRHLGRRGDLLAGGGVVPLADDQVQRGFLDRDPGPLLLELAKAGADVAYRGHGHAAMLSVSVERPAAAGIRQASAAPARSVPEATTSARSRPVVRACAADTPWPSRTSARAVATVASTAIPRAPPTWSAVLYRPLAAPLAVLSATAPSLGIAVAVRATNASPRPSPVTSSPGSREVQNDDRSESMPSHASRSSPFAQPTRPRTRTGRAPNRAAAAEPTPAARTSPPTSGRYDQPACIGEYPRTCCRCRETK